MTSPFPIVRSSAVQPANHETLFCKTLVVGNTIAAYTATLAILQAGEQVCWVQSGSLDFTQALQGGSVDPRSFSQFSWRLGRRASPWEVTGIMSRSQNAFWAHRQAQSLPAGVTHKQLPARVERSLVRSQSKESQLNQAIAPYLENRQLILVSDGEPVRVLYSENRGQRRVFQVIFQNSRTQRIFQVHAKLTLDATQDSLLHQHLVQSSAHFQQAELTLNPQLLWLGGPRDRRSCCFEDAIALTLAPHPSHPARLGPVSIPLRAFVLKQTEGFLRVSNPDCLPAMRPYFNAGRSQWTLGEALGHVAAKAAQAGGLHELRNQPHWQWRLQQTLVQQGIPIFAFDDVELNDPDFEAIQMVAIANVVRTTRNRDLSFRPETPITKAVLAAALSRLPLPAAPDVPPPLTLQDVAKSHWAREAIERAIALKLMSLEAPEKFAPSKVISQRELWEILQPLYPTDLPIPFPPHPAPARRRHLSRGLYAILQARWA